MKTLKKTLCLVLAVIMAVGVLVIPAGAVNYDDFTDKDAIEHKEAVSVLTGLGIIEGTGSGFDPNGKLNRAAGAVLVARMLATPANAKNMPVTKTFDDVESAGFGWAAEGISYGVENGYISGHGNGKFDPAGPLTGYQLAKMLLVGLGYADASKYNGNGYETRVYVDAVDTGMFDHLADPAKGLTRDEAAQMLFVALTYTETGTSTGKYVIEALASGSHPVGDALLAMTFDSVADAVMMVNALSTDSEYNQDYRVVPQTDATGSFGYKTYKRLNQVSGSVDDFGRPTVRWANADGIVAEIEKPGYKLYTNSVSLADLKKVYGSKENPTASVVKVDGQDAATSGPFGGYGVTTYVYYNKTANTVEVYSVTDYLAKVTDVDDDGYVTELTIYGATGDAGSVKDVTEVTIDPEELAVTGYKTNNYVVVNVSLGDARASASNSTIKVISVSDVKTVEDVAISRYSTSAKTLRADKTYNYGGYAVRSASTSDPVYADSEGNAAIDLTEAFSTDRTYTLYTNSDDVVLGGGVYTPGSADPTEFLYVIKVAGQAAGSTLLDSTTEAKAVAEVVFPDGSHKVVSLALDDDGNVATPPKTSGGADGTVAAAAAPGTLGSDTAVGYWFAYTVEDDEYSLTAIDGLDTMAAVEIQSNTFVQNKAISLDGKISTSATNVSIIALSSGKYTVTGFVGLPTSTITSYANAKAVITFAKNSSVITGIYVMGSAPLDDTPEEVEYAYALKAGDTVGNGVVEWTFAIDGEVVTKAISGTAPTAKHVYKLTETSTKDVFTAAEVTATGTEAFFDGGTVTVADKTFFVSDQGTFYFASSGCDVYDVSDGKTVKSGTLAEDCIVKVVGNQTTKENIVIVYIEDYAD